MPNIDEKYMLVPCGGCSQGSFLVRKVIQDLLNENPDISVFSLTPFLTKSCSQSDLLDVIPPERRILVSGCEDDCPVVIFNKNNVKFKVGLDINLSIPKNEAKEDVKNRIIEHMK